MSFVSRNDHDTSDNGGNAPSAMRKLASKTRGLLHFVSLDTEVPDEKCEIQTANVEAAMRRVQSKSGDLADAILITQEHDEATVIKLKETIEQRWFRKGHLLAEIKVKLALKAYCESRKKMAILEKEVKGLREELEKIEVPLRRDLAEQRKRQVALQLRRRNLHEAQEMADCLTAFISAKLLPHPEQQTPDAPVLRIGNGAEHAGLNDTTSRTCHKPGADPTQQRLAKAPIARKLSRRLTAWTRRRSAFSTEHEGPQRAATTATVATKSISSLHHRADATAPQRPASEQFTIARKPVPDGPASRHTPSPEQSTPHQDLLDDALACVDLRGEYWNAKCRLFTAQYGFDTRDERREAEREENRWRLQDPDCVDGVLRTQLDLEWMEHIGILTRELIDSEEAFQNCEDCCS
jgi:hypothetical protein